MAQPQERVVVSKVTWRLIPFLFLLYIIAYIDRINVGFAGLELQRVMRVDTVAYEAIYGFGAGFFFIGYFIFEVPSNLILQRVGARLWIARIMVVWGFISSGMMFINSATTFYVMRFLLGVAEAGFYPGIILYLTYWFRAQDRARTVALFATAGTLAGFVGSPVSGALLGLDGLWGLAGWQWLFLLEGIPAVLLGVVVLVYLPDRPRQARWLADEEKAWLEGELERELACPELRGRHRLRDALVNGRVWLLCAMYFLLNIAGYGCEFWSPRIIEGFLGKKEEHHFLIGLINAIPYLVATIAMVLVGRHSDRTAERRWHVAVAAAAGGVGFVLSAMVGNPILAILGLALGFSGLKSTLGPFWALGTAFLSGTAAAGGIALINSVGNLGGFVGATVVGKSKGESQSHENGLLVLGGALLVMGILALTIRARSSGARGPGGGS